MLSCSSSLCYPYSSTSPSPLALENHASPIFLFSFLSFLFPSFLLLFRLIACAFLLIFHHRLGVEIFSWSSIIHLQNSCLIQYQKEGFPFFYFSPKIATFFASLLWSANLRLRRQARVSATEEPISIYYSPSLSIIKTMSSTTASIAASAAVAATVADTGVKAARKFPPPCWTQDETLVLIDAYRERWYALRRGYLRTADWDAVAATVSNRCPDASPAKTSAQCRHKMEKLRQRYRAEKQRSLSYPYPAGRYFSSWFFFDNMEAMENGTTTPSSVEKPQNPVDGSRLNSYLDQSALKLKLKAKNTADSIPDLGFYNDVKSKRFNTDTKISTQYSPYLDIETVDKEEEEEEDMHPDEDLINFGMRKHSMNGIQIPPPKSNTKNSGKNFPNSFDVRRGFHQDALPPSLRFKKFGKFLNGNNSNEEFWVKVSNDSNNDNNNFVRAQYRASLNPSTDSRAAMNGLKRGRDAVEEMVASIKLLGEGFMKMERAKMEMAREMEARRMEMELKRNEMILESQKQIVDAFVKGMFEIKKNKKTKSGIADSTVA